MSTFTVATATGANITLKEAVIEQVGGRLQGDLVLPGSADYDEVRRVWNGMVDKRPAAIVRCATASDVAEAVGFARTSDLLVSVRGGGHNIVGNSLSHGGLVIDLSPMKGIQVDPERRTARAEPGLTLGEFDAATQAFGLATTTGINSETGIAGLTLGGGFGRLGRKHGLTCDNLLSADVVLADGRLVTASAAANPDLFWGIRGGGGNFGVVTAFEYRLHPVGPTILGGLLLHGYGRAREALRFYYEFSSTAPDEVSADAVLLTSPAGEPTLAISACYAGPVAEGERVLRPLREFGPPAQDLIAPVAYTALQASADPLFKRGRRYYWKAQFLAEISDAAIDTLLDRFAEVPSAMSLAVLQQAGGAIARVGDGDTAYGNRSAAYDCFPVSVWEDPAEDERNIAWARGFWDVMRPFSTGGVYVNNLGEEGEERVRAAYGANHGRLVALKNRYDPTNLFRLNQNITPTATTQGACNQRT